MVTDLEMCEGNKPKNSEDFSKRLLKSDASCRGGESVFSLCSPLRNSV